MKGDAAGRDAYPHADLGAVPARGPRRPARIIAIDGPAGSGKSTTARAVAAELQLPHLDSGSLYRAVTWALLQGGVPEAEWANLDPEEVRALGLRLDPASPQEPGGPPRFRVEVDGRDPGEALRSVRVTQRVSTAAAIPAVRTALLQLQRDTARRTGVVADGRDMGTVVFPDADLKIFLVADPEERARRRLLQEGREVSPINLARERALLEARDRRDSGRETAPLVQATDAVRLDTTGMDFREQVEEILRLARTPLDP
ncbi:MAG: (d)CMP kinase [Gemmatimonadales bacterium]|nr:MAG: (d)CMP kinase [Gemmatimonadales bacterium]